MGTKRKILKDLKTTHRIREHLSNKSDIISVEDIQNAKTSDFDEVPITGSKAAENENNEDHKKTKSVEKEGDVKAGMVTSWNILDS